MPNGWKTFLPAGAVTPRTLQTHLSERRHQFHAALHRTFSLLQGLSYLDKCVGPSQNTNTFEVHTSPAALTEESRLNGTQWAQPVTVHGLRIGVISCFAWGYRRILLTVTHTKRNERKRKFSSWESVWKQPRHWKHQQLSKFFWQTGISVKRGLKRSVLWDMAECWVSMNDTEHHNQHIQCW